MKWALRLLTDKAARLHYAKETFAAADHNGDGVMDMEEAVRLISSISEEMHLQLPPVDRIRTLVLLCDKSGDGTLQRDEFFSFFKAILDSAVRHCCATKLQASLRSKLARKLAQQLRVRQQANGAALNCRIARDRSAAGSSLPRVMSKSSLRSVPALTTSDANPHMQFFVASSLKCSDANPHMKLRFQNGAVPSEKRVTWAKKPEEPNKLVQLLFGWLPDADSFKQANPFKDGNQLKGGNPFEGATWVRDFQAFVCATKRK